MQDFSERMTNRHWTTEISEGHNPHSPVSVIHGLYGVANRTAKHHASHLNILFVADSVCIDYPTTETKDKLKLHTQIKATRFETTSIKAES